MANLLGANIGTNYKGFLNVGATINTPLTSALTLPVTDGMGNSSILNLGTTRVGIGTTSPSCVLEVRDSGSAPQIRINGGGTTEEGLQAASGGYLASYNPTTYDFRFGPLQMNPAFYTISFAGQNILFGDVSSGTIPLKNSVACGNSGISQGFNSISISDAYNLGVGTPTPNASAKLDVQSTTQGILFPRMTTTQKNAIASPAAGLVVYDTTLNKLCVRTNSAWQTITSA